MITRRRTGGRVGRGLRPRVVAALLALGLLAPVGVAATRAAWTDDAWVSATASAAPTWPSLGDEWCELRWNDTGAAVAGTRCEIRTEATAWGGDWWNPGAAVTSSHGVIHVGVSEYEAYENLWPETHLVFSVTYPQIWQHAVSQPDWTRARVSGLGLLSGSSGDLSADCSGITARQLSGTVRPMHGNYDEIGVDLMFDGAHDGAAQCEGP